MYEGKSHTLFAKYAVPQMIGLLFNSVYMIVDGVFIGNRLGRDAMAAAAVSVPLVEILIALSMAVSTGAGVMISAHLGQGQKERARHMFSLAALCTAVMGLLISVFGTIFIHPLAELLGSTPVIHDEAISYMWYIITFSPFLLFSFLFSGLVRNDNRPKLAMFALMFGSVSNIVLDYVFMYPLNMGIAGAALATGIGQLLSLCVYLFVYLRTELPVRLSRSGLHPDVALDGKLYAIGVPAILNLALPSLLVTFLNSLLAGFSQSYVVILGIYYKLQTFLYLPANGIVQGMRPLIGYNYGAREHARVKKLYELTLFMSIAIMALGTVICLLASGQLIGLFTSNPDTIAAGAKALRIICIGFVVSAVSTTSSGALEGLGKGVPSHSTAAALARTVCGTPSGSPRCSPHWWPTRCTTARRPGTEPFRPLLQQAARPRRPAFLLHSRRPAGRINAGISFDSCAEIR